MSHLNVEIKARRENQDKVRNILKKLNADFKGTDHQIDTYFKVPIGRLKLREGTIENHLIITGARIRTVQRHHKSHYFKIIHGRP